MAMRIWDFVKYEFTPFRDDDNEIVYHTDGPDTARAPFRVGNQPHGAASADGRVLGCYLHGLFASDDFRASFLARIGGKSTLQDYDQTVEDTLDALAAHMAQHLDLEAILDAAGAA